MSTSSSTLPSPTSTTPRGPATLAFSPVSMPETLSMPMGKYHPSNYKIAPSTTTPTSNPISIPTNLAIPSAKRKSRPQHERRTSDVKRKLQQYQRDMIAQARISSATSNTPDNIGAGNGFGGGFGGRRPVSPKLMPLGSPGPITPFELEESAGYLVAGARSGAMEREREREMVGRMIRDEERRSAGSMSPVLI